MDIQSYLLGKKSGGGGSNIDWTDVGYSSEPSVITNYGTKAHEMALSVKNKWATWLPSSGQYDSLATFNAQLKNPIRQEVICYPIFDLSTKANTYSAAFANMTNLKYIPKQMLTASAVKNCNGCFENCQTIGEIDLTSFVLDTASSTASMFSYCQLLTNIKGLNSLNTANISNMNSMFNQCRLLQFTSAINFDTTNVTNMRNMFNQCGTSTLDLSLWNTKKVTDMQGMFQDMPNLTHITFGNNYKLDAMTTIYNAFTSTKMLDDETINNLLDILTTATSYTGTKTLKQAGFTSANYPASRIQALSNYTAFTNAGWTIGYE